MWFFYCFVTYFYIAKSLFMPFRCRSGTHLVNNQPPIPAPREQLQCVSKEGDGAGCCRHAPRGPVAVTPSGVQQRRRHQHRQQRPCDHALPAMPRFIKLYGIHTHPCINSDRLSNGKLHETWGNIPTRIAFIFWFCWLRLLYLDIDSSLNTFLIMKMMLTMLAIMIKPSTHHSTKHATYEFSLL